MDVPGPTSWWDRSKRYWLALLFLAGAGMALAIDVRVAQAALHGHIPGDLRKLVNISEVFAHGFGVALILLTVFVLDPSNRRRIARVAAAPILAGLVAQLLKHMVVRIRPNVFDYQGNVFSTFARWSHLSSDALHQISRVGLQSLPSGHTASAVALAFGLAWLYPRGRWLFPAFACLAAAQRFLAPVHYVSDTLAGAAIGALVAAICLDPRFGGRLFGRYETP